ncbi:MAG: hypothetical protein FD123_3275 [Bacteroidetes bacterium]|nr:MAG: hypothetical protein FD123_3275 [Bacteroidota bacterium]
MLDYILGLAEKISFEANKLSTKDKDLIFDQVSFALEQTRAHISSTRKNDTDKSSTILSNIWQRTARNIKGVKHPTVKQLVETIEEKGKYWSDPDSYNKEQFDKYTMRITQVDSTLKKMCK